MAPGPGIMNQEGGGKSRSVRNTGSGTAKGARPTSASNRVGGAGDKYKTSSPAGGHSDTVRILTQLLCFVVSLDFLLTITHTTFLTGWSIASRAGGERLLTRQPLLFYIADAFSHARESCWDDRDAAALRAGRVVAKQARGERWVAPLLLSTANPPPPARAVNSFPLDVSVEQIRPNLSCCRGAGGAQLDSALLPSRAPPSEMSASSGPLSGRQHKPYFLCE